MMRIATLALLLATNAFAADAPSEADKRASLRTPFTGDLDGMKDRHYIRMLVVPSLVTSWGLSRAYEALYAGRTVCTAPTEEADSSRSLSAATVTSIAVFTPATWSVTFNRNCAALPSRTPVKVCV